MYNFVSSNSIVVGAAVGRALVTDTTLHSLFFAVRALATTDTCVQIGRPSANRGTFEREQNCFGRSLCPLQRCLNNSYLISLTVNVFRFPSKLFQESQNYTLTII
jgi:hypothetical protein